MKRFVLGLILALVITVSSFGQSPALTRQFTFTSATPSDAIGVFGTGINLHRIQWQLIQGTLSACTVALQGSDDNASWSNIVSGTSCTSTGGTAFVASSYGFIRINVSALTLGTARGIQVAWQGYTPIPSSSSITDSSSSTQPVQIMGSSVMFDGLSTRVTTGGTGATSGLFSIKNTPGIFIALIINTKASEATGTFKCFDAIDSTSNPAPLLSIDTKNSSGTFNYGIKMNTGIYCQNTGTVDVTVVYK